MSGGEFQEEEEYTSTCCNAPVKWVAAGVVGGYEAEASVCSVCDNVCNIVELLDD